MTTLLKVCGAIQNIVFGRVLLSLRLLCRADDCVSNLDCEALRAMTGHGGESATMLFGTIMQLLKLCGAIHKFDHRSTFALRRIDLSQPNNYLIAPLVDGLIICPIIISLLRSY